MTALPSAEDLERLAKAITPGPWRVGPVDDTRVEDADGNEVAQIDGDYNQPETWPLMEANAEAVALLPALIREVIDRRWAEAGMRALLRTGCDLLADEYDNLKDSVTMPDGSLSASPLDAWAVEKVAAMEDWIASVKAALYRATPTTEASHDD